MVTPLCPRKTHREYCFLVADGNPIKIETTRKYKTYSTNILRYYVCATKTYKKY